LKYARPFLELGPLLLLTISAFLHLLGFAIYAFLASPHWGLRISMCLLTSLLIIVLGSILLLYMLAPRLPAKKASASEAKQEV